ncbi:MAG: hypothetical protein Q8P00_05605, partial [Dehalococcoidia bacterium]|nr:hypothetical protein [Dehalococcoidia bacterium]
SNRWVSYFDLLGFSELVNTREWFDVWLLYSKALKEFKEEFGLEPHVEKIWFSDTFVLYSSDDSNDSFISVEAMSRAFVYSLVCRGIPLRGAMSYGNFYANRQNSVFFGPAFIEAYNYGEHQDWVGFVLTPSAIKQMEIMGFPAHERLNYAYWDIPFKSLEQKQTTHLPAYIIGGNLRLNGRNLSLDKLREIKLSLQSSHNTKFVNKYENTIRFIEANERKSSSR